MKFLTRLLFLGVILSLVVFYNSPVDAASDGIYSLDGGFAPTVTQSTDGVYNMTSSNSIFSSYSDDGTYILYPGVSSAVLASLAGANINGGSHPIIIPAVAPNVSIGGTNYLSGDMEDPNNAMQLDGSTLILSFSNTDVNYIAISYDGNFEQVSWEPLSNETIIDLGDKTGEQILYLKFMNNSGSISDVKKLYFDVIENVVGMELVDNYSVSMALGKSLTINMDKDLSVNTDALCESGSLIKLPSDNDLNTQIDSAVYYCGADGKRYVFPNPAVYFTWYLDFSNILEMDQSLLSKIPLGGNVTSRPGVRMVKFTTDSKTYAVDKNGVLLWVQNEATATALYGNNWNQKIDDISDTFFLDYKIGDVMTIADTVLINVPEKDSVISNCSASVFFVEFLELGSSNSEVLPLQNLLQCLGYFPQDVTANGYFGPVTEAAVKAFQAANGIDPLGYVGPGTRAALNN